MKILIFILIILSTYFLKEGFSKKKKTSRCKKGYAANEPILIVISFDGFKTEYINSSHKTLVKLFEDGVKSEFRSLRFANALNVHHTIATGYFPNKHGVFAHSWKDKNNYNVTYNRSQYENDIFRKHNIIPIWTLNELNGGTSACMMWPGCEFRYGPNSEVPIFTHTYNHSEEYKSRLKKVIEWMNESVTLNPPNLVMMYFNQPDHTAHRYGPNSSNVGDRVKELDKFVEDFLAKLDTLKLLKRVDIVFVSDHRVFEIHYKDIFQIESKGLCTDVGLFGSDVWLQQLYYTRVSGNTTKCNGEYCRMEQCCYNPKNRTELMWLNDDEINHHLGLRKCTNCVCERYHQDKTPKPYHNCDKWGPYPWKNCTLQYCYMNTRNTNREFTGHHPKQYNLSKCLKYMYESNVPEHFLYCPWRSDAYEEIPTDIIANFTILVSDYEGYGFNLTLDSPITLSYKAFATNLYPKIRNWTTECPLEITNCTPFGVHGYRDKDTGFFLAIGPSFIKNTTFLNTQYSRWQFAVEDLYSCFARVLKIKGTFNNDGYFARIKPVLSPDLLGVGAERINWLKQFLVIFVCSVIHCIVFYIAANIYLIKRWVQKRKLIKKRNINRIT